MVADSVCKRRISSFNAAIDWQWQILASDTHRAFFATGKSRCEQRARARSYPPQMGLDRLSLPRAGRAGPDGESAAPPASPPPFSTADCLVDSRAAAAAVALFRRPRRPTACSQLVQWPVGDAVDVSEHGLQPAGRVANAVTAAVVTRP